MKQITANVATDSDNDYSLSFLPHHDKQTGDVFLLFEGYKEEKDKISGVFQLSHVFIDRKEKVILSVKITANGELSKTILYDTNDKDKCTFRPQASMQVNEKEYILFSKKMKSTD